MDKEPRAKPLWQRLAWLVVIWTASVAALSLVAIIIRIIMNGAGLTTPT